MKTRRLTAAGLTAAAALMLAACAPGGPVAQSEPPSPEPAMSDEAMEEPVEPDAEPSDAMEAEPIAVPDQLQFTTITVADEKPFDAASLAGQNVIFWFWAPWCPNCQAESGAVAAAANELPDDVTLIGISGRAEVPDMQAFLPDYGVGNFEHIVDPDGSVWAAFGVASQPAFALLDDDGSIRTIPGPLGKSGVLQAAQELSAS